MPSCKVLVVDDEEGMRRFLIKLLSGSDCQVFTCATGPEAVSLAEREGFDVAVIDLKLPGMDGLEVLQRLRQISPTSPAVMMTAYGTVETAVQAMKLGAFDYISKPFDADEMEVIVEKAVQHHRLLEENLLLKSELHSRSQVGNIIGQSPKMQQVYALIRKVAPTDVPVLILGESGTGKELVARAIHAESNRKDRIFLSVNCSALTETLLESELFGHERGAFTGAVTSKKGLFEAADRGTLFLDEIGEMAPSLQAKLLRVVQEREFIRVGGHAPQTADVRLLTSTNRDLKKEVEAQRFRDDLYYRLNVVCIALPPLRERREDIPPLIGHFLRKYAAVLQKPVTRVALEAMSLLLEHPWPGNVRQLEHAIEHGVVMAAGEELQWTDLPSEVRDLPPAWGDPYADLPLRQAREAFERQYLVRLLRKHRGNVSQAAREAGMHRTSLYEKMRQLEIDESAVDVGPES